MRERIDLAGRWELAFDPTGEGIRNGWTEGRWPEERADAVEVPAIWNVTNPDAEGPGFYRRLVRIPPDWEGRVVRLAVGGASYRLDAWMNHRYVGGHEGAYTPFTLDVMREARPGEENELIVKVTALSKDRPVEGMVLAQSPASKQAWYYTYGGLWGNVALEALPLLSCRTVTVEPDLRGRTARVEVTAENAYCDPRAVELRVCATDPDGVVAAESRISVGATPGCSRYVIAVPIDRPHAWSCEYPNLYRLRAEVVEGEAVVDAVETAFGMRDFTVRDGRFFLNGEPIFLKIALLQPNFPVTLVAPHDPALMLREITLMKEAGFNAIRAHVRPAPPGYLDLTDRLGMLVYAETSLAWIRDSARVFDHGRREIEALIARDRNHPSVVIWGIHNENRAVSARTADDFVRHARALDPTRVVIDHSGGSMAIDQDFGWVDRATVVANRETERQPFQDLHVYFGAPTPRAALDWMRTIGAGEPATDIVALGYGLPAVVAEWQRSLRTYQGQIFVSEIGCGGMADLDRTLAGFGERHDLLDARELRAFRNSLHEGFAARGLGRVFPSVAALAEAAQLLQIEGDRRQIEALMLNPRVSGYGLTQINDVAWEFHAGILDLWREPKPVYHELKRLNQPRCLILSAAADVGLCGGEVEVSLALVDRRPGREGEWVEVTVRDPSRREEVVAVREVPRGIGTKELGVVPVRLRGGPGEYWVEARVVGVDCPGVAREVVLGVEPSPPAAAQRVPRPSEGEGSVLIAADPAVLSRDDWDELLGAVEAGRTAVIGPLRPGDEVARQALARRGVAIELHMGFGNWMGCYHWIPRSAIFAGLPAGGLAGQAYADVLPQYALSELGGEVLAGSFRNTETRKQASRMLWYSDVEAVAVGRGKLIFCQYRVFDAAPRGPLGDRLLSNLLGYAEDRTR